MVLCKKKELQKEVSILIIINYKVKKMIIK